MKTHWLINVRTAPTAVRYSSEGLDEIRFYGSLLFGTQNVKDGQRLPHAYVCREDAEIIAERLRSNPTRNPHGVDVLNAVLEGFEKHHWIKRTFKTFMIG